MPLCSVSRSSVRRCYLDWRFLPQAFLMQSPYSFLHNSSCSLMCSVMVFLIAGSVPLGVGRGARARCPGPSGAAWQPAGAAAAGAAGQGTRLASAHTSVISHFRSAKTHGLTPSGPNDLWNRICLLGLRPLWVYFKFLSLFWTSLLQRCRISKAPHCLQQCKLVHGNEIRFLLLSPQKMVLLHLYHHSALTGLIQNFNVSEGGQ